MSLITLVIVFFACIILDFITKGGSAILVGFNSIVVCALGLWQNSIHIGYSAPLTYGLKYAFLGFALGHVVYVFSSLMTNVTPKEILAYMKQSYKIIGYYTSRPGLFLSFLGMAYFEEILWRAIIQKELIEVMGFSLVGIVATAAFFTIMHFKYFDELPIRWLEFSIFSLFLGWVYLETSSLLLVTVIHAVRNIHVTYFGHWDEEQSSLSTFESKT